MIVSKRRKAVTESRELLRLQLFGCFCAIYDEIKKDMLTNIGFVSILFCLSLIILKQYANIMVKC